VGAPVPETDETAAVVKAMAGRLEAMLTSAESARRFDLMIVLYTTERDYPWGTLRSTHASKTKVVLEEKRIRYRIENLRTGDLWKKPPEMLARHPLGKVPYIEDEGVTIYDSTVIDEYLDDRYGSPRLLPDEPLARARVRQLEQFADEALLAAAVAGHGERVVVSIDVRGGMVSTAGWTQTGSLGAVAAARELSARGVRSFVYTDVDRDGMLGGLDLAAIVRVTDAVEGELVYSGGIGSLEDLRALAALRHPRLAGVIAGKALYERRFTIEQAEEALCT